MRGIQFFDSIFKALVHGLEVVPCEVPARINNAPEPFIAIEHHCDE